MRLFEDDYYWVQTKDGDPVVLELYERHYSCYEYKDGRIRDRIVGPGERIVLKGKNNDALFVWRKFISGDGQQGINCAVFRNETVDLFDVKTRDQIRWKQMSSALIEQAEKIALKRWPGERFYTYVNPKKVKSTNPGCCFKKCGWRRCGETKKRKLIIFEKLN